MIPTWATTAVNLAGIYLVIGCVLGPLMVWGASSRLDSAVSASTFGFRLMILPGSILLWPILLGRVIRGRGTPPEEHNAHRDAAARGSTDPTSVLAAAESERA